MADYYRELYTSIERYIAALLVNRTHPSLLIDILVKMQINIEIFATTVKMYRKMYEYDDLYQKLLNIENGPSKSESGMNASQHVGEGTDCPFTASSSSGAHMYKIAQVCCNDLLNHRYVDAKTLRNAIKNSFTIFIVCCIISYKHHHDISYTNEAWAQMAGLDLSLVNCIEREILILTDYNISFAGDQAIFDDISPFLDQRYFPLKAKKKQKFKKPLFRKLFCR
ncbi:hypothetical protein ENBRE01_0928 [Enteropsectra breve]|nr:hypothetical protein ENBRE01_0928 [Enteropsectra breve]